MKMTAPRWLSFCLPLYDEQVDNFEKVSMPFLVFEAYVLGIFIYTHAVRYSYFKNIIVFECRMILKMKGCSSKMIRLSIISLASSVLSLNVVI